MLYDTDIDAMLLIKYKAINTCINICVIQYKYHSNKFIIQLVYHSYCYDTHIGIDGFIYYDYHTA